MMYMIKMYYRELIIALLALVLLFGYIYADYQFRVFRLDLEELNWSEDHCIEALEKCKKDCN